MNPWEVLGTDKPTPIYVDAKGVEHEAPGNGRTLVGTRYTVTYRNGQMVTYLRRPGAPADGSQDEQESFSTNTQFKDDWDKANGAPARTDITASGGVQTTQVTDQSGNTRVARTEPDPNAPKPAQRAPLTPGEAAADEVKTQELVERRRNSAQHGIPFTDIELQAWIKDEQTYRDAQDEKTRLGARQAQLDKENAAQRAFDNDLKLRGEKRDDAELGIRQQAANRPQVTEVGGRLVAIDRDEKGAPRSTDITPQSNPGEQKAFPQGKLLGEFGQVLVERQQELIEEVKAGKKTNEQAEKELTRYKDIVNTLVTEQVGLGNIQKGAYDSAVRQRGDTLQDDASRRTFATNSLDRVQKTAMENARYLPESARGTMGAAMRGGLEQSLAMAAAMGALKQRNEIQQGSAIMQLMGQSINGTGQSQQGAQAPASQSAASPGGGITINNITPQADPRSFMGMGIDPAHNINNGQITAPGFKAPDPDEEASGGGFPWMA